MSRVLSVLAVTTVLSLATSAANATLFIGLQQDVSPIATVASSPIGASFFSGAFGNFEGIFAGAFGQPSTVLPTLIQGSVGVTNNAGAPDGGTLSIYVTSTGNAAPLGALNFTSGFATVNLSRAGR